MSIKASRFYGIGLALLGVVAFAACSSDEGGTPGGTAGTTNGTAGTVGTAGTGVGGSTGTAGTTTGTAGTVTGTAGTAAGGTGAGGGSSTACAGTKPASALITEFADLVANPTSAGNYTFTLGVPGGTFSYQAGALTAAITGGVLNIKGNVKAYDGFGVYTTACTDASAYTGVSFNIKGKPGPGGKVNFRVQTNATTAVDLVNKKGTCAVPAGTTDTYPLCHPSSVDVPVTEAGAVVTVKFADLVGGVPVAAVDGKDIVGFEWAFAWAGATDTPYDADITVDDLKFTGGTSGGTGSGGSGGSGGAAAGSGGSGGAAAGSGGSGGNQ